MEENAPTGTVMRQADVEWKVTAVVSNDSKQFAKELEEALNNGSKEGFVLASMITRSTDNGLVLIQQRTIIHIHQPLEQDPGRASGAN